MDIKQSCNYSFIKTKPYVNANEEIHFMRKTFVEEEAK